MGSEEYEYWAHHLDLWAQNQIDAVLQLYRPDRDWFVAYWDHRLHVGCDAIEEALETEQIRREMVQKLYGKNDGSS